jgi:DHA1 family multidrug resistance protein-like MFS transporter
MVWRVSLILGLAQLGFSTILPLLPLYLTERLGASVKLVGVVVATFALVETAFKTAWGSIADRFGRKPAMIAGCLVAAVAPLVMSVLRVPLLFVPLRFVDGIGSAALWPSAAASIAETTTPDRRATGMAVLNTAFLGGIAAGPALGLFVVGFAHNFQAGFYLASGLLVLGGLMAFILLPGGRPSHHADGTLIDYHPTVQPAHLEAIMGSFRTSPVLFWLYLIAFIQMFGIGMLVPIAAIYAKRVIGLGEHEIGVLFLLVVIVVALATIPAGRLADRVGKSHLITAGMVLGALGMWLIPFSERLWLLLIAGVLLGSSYALMAPAWLALVTELAPQGRLGLAVGASETVQGLGLVLGPLLGGLLWDGIGPKAPFIACAAALTAGAVIGTSVLRHGVGVGRKAG